MCPYCATTHRFERLAYEVFQQPARRLPMVAREFAVAATVGIEPEGILLATVLMKLSIYTSDGQLIYYKYPCEIALGTTLVL